MTVYLSSKPMSRTAASTLRMRPARSDLSLATRIVFTMMPMIRAAARPLPETSPTTRRVRSSSTGIAS